VARFFNWLSDHEDLKSLDEVNERHLSAYHAHLQYGKTKKGAYLASTTLRHRLFAVKLFYRVMYQERLVKHDYAHLITPPRQKQRIPKNVPSERDVASMLDKVEPTTLLGIRNRALLELLYATGIRNMELRLLTLEDLNLAERTLFIHGKGAKDRLVPVGAWVVPYLMEYLEAVRPKLLRGKKSELLFVTKSGNKIPAENLCYIVRTRAKEAGLSQRLNPHSMRHACATHMLRGGADIRYIQELLRHTELSTTQVYTHVDISTLKKAHHQFHPREKSADAG
jgi:integrase/recombinase XerD